eukprot:UN05090
MPISIPHRQDFKTDTAAFLITSHKHCSERTLETTFGIGKYVREHDNGTTEIQFPFGRGYINNNNIIRDSNKYRILFLPDQDSWDETLNR